MARSTATSSTKGGPSKIRFIMLEADLTDGNLNDITQAISNALRPHTAAHQRLIAAPAVSIAPLSDAVSPAAGSGSSVAGEPPMLNLDSEAPAETAIPAPAKPSRPSSGSKKYPSPNVVDVDLTSDVSWSSFAAQKNPDSDLKKYLVVAAWFKLHRNISAITKDHVYTCFRAVKWPTSIADFEGPLRAQKKRKVMDQTGRGLFAINHLGMAEVDEMG